MSTNLVGFDALTTSLITLTGIRLLGTVVFLDLWVKKREQKYLLLIVGWLFATLGSAWGLYTHLSWETMEHAFFSLLAALGTFWIGCGILAYFQEIDIIFKFVNRRFLVLVSGLILVYGLLPFFGVGLGPSPGIFVQLFMALLVIFAALFKRRAFISLARSSYTWLVVLAILSSGLTLTFALGAFGPDGLALGFAGTTVVQFVAIIFFLHLEFSLTYRQLKNSEQRFMRLAENAQDLIYRYEFAPQRGFSYVSPAATAITGYTPEEHYADPGLGFKLVYPDDRHLLDDLAKGEIEKDNSLILRWEKKDGSIIWCEQRNVPVHDEHGNLIALEGIARDITQERKAAQQYQLLFREMLEGFALHEIILDDDNIPVDYCFLAINPAFEKMTGLLEPNVIGQTVLEVLPDTEPFWIETYGQVALTGEPAHFIEYSRALGKYFEVTAFQPAPKQFAVIITDVTERLETETLLKKSEEKYRLLVENQQDMIVKVDAEGNFLYVSPSFCRTFGKPEKELLGKNFLSMLHKEDLSAMLQAMESLEPPHYTIHLEQRAMIKDSWKWQAWSATGVLDDQGEIVEVIGHGVDITERKQAEDALRRLKENLEIQVDEKTQELQQRIDELERYRDATVEREFRMKELRDKIKRLKNKD